MKVWDLFPFFNELPLLDLRLAELDSVVDVFGLVELPRTFTDLAKPLFYQESGREHPKISVYAPPSYPSGPHPTVDWFQRKQTAHFIGNADPDDVVMLSDVDEIPDREAVKRYVDDNIDHPMTFRMKLFYHRVDLMDRSPWFGTVICRRRHLGEAPDMQELREHRSCFPPIDAGWHFSWLGDAAAIKEKLRAVDIPRENAIYGAAGINEPNEDPAFLQDCYEKGLDLFGRENRIKQRVSILPGINQPHEIVSWLERYPQYAAMDQVPY